MNYTAEEVRETERILRKHSNGPGTFDYEASDMLNAYADMIESVQGEAWSHRMATKEAGQYVCAGAHGIPNTPAPTAEPVAQGEACKICGKDTPHYHLRGNHCGVERDPKPAQSVDVEKVREVIASHIEEAKKLRHDPESQDYLYEQADKLVAAIQEKSP